MRPGDMPTPVSLGHETQAAPLPRPEPPGLRASGPPSASEPPSERLTIAEMLALQAAGEPVVLLDVRTERSYRESARMAAGASRYPPDDAVRLARERRLPRDAIPVLYCT